VAKKRTVKIVFLVLLVLITGVVGYYATRYISYQNALKKAQESYVIPKQETPTSTLTEETPTTTTTATTATTATTPTAPACTIEPTNILVLGIDTANHTTEGHALIPLWFILSSLARNAFWKFLSHEILGFKSLAMEL